MYALHHDFDVAGADRSGLSLVTQASPTQHVTVSSNAPFQEHSIRRIKFEMYILDREGQRKLHAYSSLQSEIGSASRALEEAKDWRIKYPRLAPYYDRGELDVEIILFETYFSLMEEQPPYKSKLRIDFEIDVARGVEFTQWECHAYFYENDILEERVSTPTNLERLPGTSDARIIVGLHSSWWVDRFVALANQGRGSPCYKIRGREARLSNPGYISCPRNMGNTPNWWKIETHGTISLEFPRKQNPRGCHYDMEKADSTMSIDRTLLLPSDFDFATGTTFTSHGHNFPSSGSIAAYTIVCRVFQPSTKLLRGESGTCGQPDS